jgi:anti-sigma factor RsiW
MAQACKQFLESLVDYFDGKLNPAGRAAFDRHAAHCVTCRILRDSTRKTIQLYRSIELSPVPNDIEARLLRELDKRIALGRRRAPLPPL